MTGFALKLIAICCMLIDHIAASVPVFMLEEQLGWSPVVLNVVICLLRGIGRVAFPIFAFFIAEGCRHTRSPWRYLGRLLAFGLISEIPFRLVFDNGWQSLGWSSILDTLSFLNVFFTLALGAFACFACKALRDKGRPVLALLPALPLAALAEALGTDYGALGVLLIFAAYACPEKKSRLAAMAAVLTAVYAAVPLLNQYSALYLLYWPFALLALIPLACYNGQRGRPVKWAFYAFYPVHLTLLALVLIFWVRPFLAVLS